MPIDDLTALGQKMREARKNKELTQQELSDLSHVSVNRQGDRDAGSFIGYTGSISAPWYFNMITAFIPK